MATVTDRKENSRHRSSTDLVDSPQTSPAAGDEPESIAAAWQAEREKTKRRGLEWPIVLWLAGVHIGALAAPFLFTWQGLAVFVFLSWFTGSIGICLGFHRLLTHRSFKTYRPIRWLIAWIGGLAGEGPAIFWVSNHRKHHAYSDKVGDPHSPLDGPWWAHMFWCLWARNKQEYDEYNMHWSPDLARDPVLRFLDRTFILWHIVLGGALFGIGYWMGGAAMAWSLVVWGVFFRMTYVLHATWLVNSASHIWGYRTYKTTDDSRNNWWVALLTFGEGWHNNHHAFPTMARAGHRWWEIDVTFWALRLMQFTGLAWGIVDGQHKKPGVENKQFGA